MDGFDTKSMYQQSEMNRSFASLAEPGTASQQQRVEVSKNQIVQSATPDEFMRIIGPTDEDFSGLKVTVQHVKGNINSCKNVVYYLEKQGDIHAEHAKLLKKCAQSTMTGYNSSNTKQGSFALHWKGVLEGGARNAEECEHFSKKLCNYATSLSQDTKRFEKDSKKLQNLAESSIKQYKESDKTLAKAKTKFESAKVDLQNYVYQNKPVNPTVVAPKTLKSFEKTLAEKTKKLEHLECLYQEAKENFELLRGDLFAKTIPSITRGLVEIDLELSEAANKILHSYSTDLQILSREYDKENRLVRLKIGKIDDAKDFAHYLSKFFYYSRNDKETEVCVLGVPLKDCVERREAMEGKIQVLPPQILARCFEYLNKYGKNVSNVYTRKFQAKNSDDPSPLKWFESFSEENVLMTANFVKRFFAELPEPLLDFGCLEVAQEKEAILNEMQIETFVIFKALIEHFHALISAGNSSSDSLCAVFVPLLFGPNCDLQVGTTIIQSFLF